jgi:hypothetical protein
VTTPESRLYRRIRRDFPEPGSANGVLHQLENLTQNSNDDMLGTERVHAAIVLLAAGDIAQLKEAVTLAKTDWRDLLVAAGLAHEDWRNRLDQELGRIDTSAATEESEPPH